MTLISSAMQAADLDFVTIDAAPWAYRDTAGRPAGAFPDIAAELARRTGQPISVELYPLVRVEQAMASGGKDCTIVLWNDHRSTRVLRGEEVYPMPFGVIARKGVPLRRYEDLAPLTVSVTRGLAMDARFDADASLRKEVDKDYLTGLRKLARGRVDAVAGALPTIRHIAGKTNLGGELGETLTLGRVPLALQCSRASPRAADSLPRLNEALRAMRVDGSLPRLLAAHGYFR